MLIEKHPGPFIGPDVELARAAAMAVVPFYGQETGEELERATHNIWNDHVAVQAALAAIHYIRKHGMTEEIADDK